ncbi:MAG: sulfatase-like hydrolase/transferase, partial [Pirellulaceae bacterium]|nr:sulfatase-like hydrolase/transferase [Pirellulaceae bacterium]
AENLIGEEGMGFRYIIDSWNVERILIAAECIGDGDWFINKAAAYTSTPQFDPAVAEVPHFWSGEKGKPSRKTEIYDIPAKATMDSRSTDKAINFIESRSAESQPFFVYVGFTHFHPPWGVHPDFAGKPASMPTQRWRSITTWGECLTRSKRPELQIIPS